MEQRSQAGFSIIEILVVVGIIGIMSAVAIFYATNHKKAYQPDDQALMLADMLQEARQRSLTQRRTMRVEINLSSNTAKLYDENANATSSSDDVVLKAMNLFAPTNVKVDSRPSQVAYNPAESMPVPTAVFKPSVYTPSISQSVCTIRFFGKWDSRRCRHEFHRSRSGSDRRDASYLGAEKDRRNPIRNCPFDHDPRCNRRHTFVGI